MEVKKIKTKELKVPRIGARTIKTGITVFLCSLISLFLFKRETGIISSMSGITCLENSLETSVNNGKNRIIGTIVGALTGFIVMYICNSLNSNSVINSLIAGVGTVVTIYICVLFSINKCINTACVMFLILIMDVGQEKWLTYSIIRTVDTFIGVLIGITVNKYIFKKSFNKVKKD